MAAELTGRAAIVTGAGGGIGRATALELAALGASIVVNDIGRRDDGSSTAEAVAEEIRAAGGNAAANSDSVCDFDGAQRMIETALREFGSVDILVNNAGISWNGAPWDLDAESFNRVVETHIQGSFFCARHALGPMREQGWGRIVNLVSRAGLTGMPGTLAYGVGKGGVLGLTNTLSRDLVGSGITVNAVNPSATRTPMVAKGLEGLEAMGKEGRQRAASLRSQMQPAERVAVVIATLCLPASEGITGQIFYVERNQVGLFQPLTVTQDVNRDEAWTPAELSEAIAKFDLHSLEDAYS